MKSARRHELQKNELADWLGQWIESLEPYWKWIAVGGLAVVVLAGVIALLLQRQRAAAGRAWAEYLAAVSTTTSMDRHLALRDVAAVYAGTPAALWATIDQADTSLAEGTQLLFRSKDEGQKALREAITNYELALQQTKDPFLLQRLHFSRGRAHEALGELKQARTAYEEALSYGEKTAIGTLAKERLELLQRDDIQKFYDWFVTQRPTVAMGQSQPSNSLTLPEHPDISLPERSGDGTQEATSPPAEPPSPSAESTLPPNSSRAKSSGGSVPEPQAPSTAPTAQPDAPVPSQPAPGATPQKPSTNKPPGDNDAQPQTPPK